MRNSIPPERREEFARDWVRGVRVAEMAAKYGCAHATVSMTARRLGMGKRKRGSGQPDPVDDLALPCGEWRPGRHGVLFWTATTAEHVTLHAAS